MTQTQHDFGLSVHSAVKVTFALLRAADDEQLEYLGLAPAHRDLIDAGSLEIERDNERVQIYGAAGIYDSPEEPGGISTITCCTFNREPDAAMEVAAHEIGHFLSYHLMMANDGKRRSLLNEKGLHEKNWDWRWRPVMYREEINCMNFGERFTSRRGNVADKMESRERWDYPNSKVRTAIAKSVQKDLMKRKVHPLYPNGFEETIREILDSSTDKTITGLPKNLPVRMV